MPERIATLNEEGIKGGIRKLVRGERRRNAEQFVGSGGGQADPGSAV